MPQSQLKQIHVSAAVIHKTDLDGTKKIFATQRGYGEWKDWWEFPGGKIENGESPEQAIVREIKEELDSTIQVDHFLCTVEHDYPTFHLTMECFFCTLVAGSLTLLEHENARWLTLSDLDSVNWLPADVKALESVRISLKKSS